MEQYRTKGGTELPLINLKGKPYLQVAHRLVWFREERPDWLLSTEVVDRTEQYVVMRAVVRSPDGAVLSTAHKREDYKHFTDAIEKAETGAIGRALGFLGYGTQFAPEILEADSGGDVVDAPIQQPKKSQAQQKILTAIKGTTWKGKEVADALKTMYGVEKADDLQPHQLQEFLSYIKDHQKAV